jgi:hypothetical protein
LKNIDYLLQFSAKLMVITQVRSDNNEKDADAQADYLAAANNYQALLAWRERISGRIAYDKTMLGGAGISAVGRDTAKDAARDARESSADAARQTGSEAARGMNCKDGR